MDGFMTLVYSPSMIKISPLRDLKNGCIVLSVGLLSLLTGMAAPFSQKASLQGITFQVKSPNADSDNTVTVTAKGLSEDSRPITTKVEGTVTGMEVADINTDGAPEVYIFIAAPNRGELLAFSSNKNKSLSSIFLPELEEETTGSPVYRGGDQFAVLENALGRRFPLFPKTAGTTSATGKIRQVQYKLVPGESGWQLKPYRVTDF